MQTKQGKAATVIRMIGIRKITPIVIILISSTIYLASTIDQVLYYSLTITQQDNYYSI